jgi:hypothetical protein
MTLRRCIVVFLFLSLGAAAVHAQRNRQFGNRSRGPFDSFFGVSVDQNEPPETEFVFARWHYGTGRYGGGGWAHDYPNAEEHILQVMKTTTGIDLDRLSYRVVELGSPEIFKYPFSYVSEPGEMELSDDEVENLRQYINRGGFVMVDDFGGQGQGPWEFEAFRSNLLRAFPDRDMFVLTDEHLMLNNFYNIDSLQTVHPMTGVKSVFYGYPDGKGGLSMIICYANDVGDFWEFIDQPYYPVKPSAEALKLGINFVMYAFTH